MAKTGDVVELKSGGCHMTVVGFQKIIDEVGREYTTVNCMWMTDSFGLSQADFDSDVLRKIEGE